MSTNSKRISVFDRLGPGNDEGTSSHHRYNSDKHGSGGGYVGGGQEKSRGHLYGSSGSSQHVLKEDRDDTASPASRERKGRHRSSLMDFPGGMGTAEGEGTEEKRSSLNPQPGKCSRDAPEALKNIGGMTSRAGLGSGDSDFDESVEEVKRRKKHRGGIDLDPALRSKHTSDALEDDPNNSRRSGRERNDKESVRSDRPGSSGSGGGASGSDGPPHKSSPDKTRSRRECNMAGSYDHKRLKEEDVRSEFVAEHKRKRDLQEDSSLPPDAKKMRHRDHSRESDHHHHHHTLTSSISCKEAERYHCSPTLGISSGSGKETDRHRGGGSERKRRQESNTILAESSRKRAMQSHTPEPPLSGGREKASGMMKSHHKHGKEINKRMSVVDCTSEHGRGEGGGGRSRSLDWEAVRNFTEKANAKLRRVHTGVLDQFKAGVVLGSVGVSAMLAGPDYYQRVKQAILRDGGDDTNLQEEIQQGEEEDHEVQLHGMVEEEERGLVRVSQQPRVPEEAEGSLNWDKVAGECLLSCRQALTASDDYAIRRLLRKDQGFMAPSRPAPDTWTTDQYGLSLELYKSIPTKPSGKPALKLQPSRVGTLVITR